MGLLLVVAVLLAALLVSGLGSRIVDGVEVAICRIGGGDCQVDPHADGRPPLSECVTGSSTRGISGAVKVFFVTLGGGVEGVKEVRADGTARVTLKGNAKAGLKFSTPGAEADVGSTEAGTGERSAKLTGKGEVGKAWTFADEAAADDFLDDVEKKVVASLDPRWNLPFTDDDADIELPEAGETIYSGGVEVSLKAELKSGTGLEGNLGAGVGATFNQDPDSPGYGDKTYFFELAGGGRASGEAGPFEIGGGGQGKTRVAITYGRDGREKSMRVIGQLDVTGSGSLSEVFAGQDLEGFLDGAERLKVTGAEEVGGRLVFDAKVDLADDPENLAAVRAFLDGRDPETGQPVSKVDATQRLFHRFNETAVVNGRVYGLSKSQRGFDVDGSVFGVSGEYTSEDATLLDAYYRSRDEGGFTRWEECVRKQR